MIWNTDAHVPTLRGPRARYSEIFISAMTANWLKILVSGPIRPAIQKFFQEKLLMLSVVKLSNKENFVEKKLNFKEKNIK